MKRRYLLSLLVFTLLGVVVAGSAEAYWGRDLTIGVSGEDVRELQVLLNGSVDTRLAASGVGSPGLETTYFGSLTAAAVKRFQDKYASEILLPLGLSAGTGYVGASTRAKLNQLAASPTINTAQPSDISGLGRVIEAVLITNGSELEVGDTNSTNSEPLPTDRLVITGISPNSGSSGTKVTITGKGFLPTGNTIYTSYGQVTAGSSDGVTLTFTFKPPFADEVSGKASYLDFDAIPVRFYVGNINGLSGSSPEFKMKF